MKNECCRSVRASAPARPAITDPGDASWLQSWSLSGLVLALSWCLLAAMPAGAAEAEDYSANQGSRDVISLAVSIAAPVAPQRPPAPRPARIVVGAAPAAPESHGVFGSVAIAFRPLPALRRWRAVLAEQGDKYFRQGCKNGDLCGSSTMKNLRQIRRDAAGLPREAMLELVNRRVNRALAYKSDEATFGQLDHWAGLGETMRQGAADCEDFAIAKMWMLKSLGFKLDDMQFVVLRDVSRGRYHAVLAAHLGSKTLVLDNITDAVYPDEAARYYKPIYSLSRSGSWIHGFRFGQPSLAASGGGFAAVHPGAR